MQPLAYVFPCNVSAIMPLVPIVMPLVPMKAPYAIIIFALTFGGCFYPPQQKPIPSSGTQITLALPYDLAWDAAHTVIAQNGYRIITEDPDNGIVEAQAVGGFTTNDADCGKLKGIAESTRPSPTSIHQPCMIFMSGPKATKRAPSAFGRPSPRPYTSRCIRWATSSAYRAERRKNV